MSRYPEWLRYIAETEAKRLKSYNHALSYERVAIELHSLIDTHRLNTYEASELGALFWYALDLYKVPVEGIPPAVKGERDG